MKHEVEVGINYKAVNNGHGPASYEFSADCIVNIVGAYGVTATDYPTRAFVTVDLPDCIAHSEKYAWDLAIPGRTSKSGTADMCFVVCGQTAREHCKYFGSLDAKALIMRAIDSGLYMIYPDENGAMQKTQLSPESIRWLEW